MKDKKRLEVTLSVRGDGSLSRNNLRSSNRSNRSNASSNSSTLPVSEIFATDRFSAPHNRPFDILDKYRRQPNQYGYPAQSLQAINHYQQSENNGYGIRERNNPYIDYTDSSKPYYHQRQPQQQHNVGQQQYQPVYNDPSILQGTLPRSVSRQDQQRGNPVYDESFRSTLPRSASHQDQQRDNPYYGNQTMHGSLPRSISRNEQQRNNPIYNEEPFRSTLPRSVSRQDQQRDHLNYNDGSMQGSLPRTISRNDQHRNNPIYIEESSRLHGSMPRLNRVDDQRGNPGYNDPSARLHGTLPRSMSRQDQQRSTPIYPNSHYTLPAKYGPRRVRISELEPIVHGYNGK